MNSDFLEIDIIMLLFRHYLYYLFIAIILGSYRSSDVWLLDSQFMAEMEESEAKICEHNVT